MRTFHIDYTNAENKLPDGDIVGKYGEHNATILSITPPAEMTESEEIICYRIAFGLTNCRTVTSEQLEKAETVSLPLNAQITRSDTLSVQLVGYDAENNLVMKSETVKKLKFAESVGGTEISADGNSHNLGAEVIALKKTLEELSNIVIRPTKTITFSDAEVFAYNYDTERLGLLFWEEPIPIGTEIKTIRIKYNGAWVDIHELNTIDSVPYILNLNRCYIDEYDTGGYVVALLGKHYYWGEVATALKNQQIKEIEIVYYTEGGAE